VGPGDTKALQFTVKGNDAGTVKNVATVSSTNANPKSAEWTVDINAELPPVEVRSTLQVGDTTAILIAALFAAGFNP
jgi:hypothetical protein